MFVRKFLSAYCPRQDVSALHVPLGWASFLIAAVALFAQETLTYRVDVNLVRVTCSVTDASGAPVSGLDRQDFILLDDGIPRDVKYFWQESDLPLTIGLVADVSGSQYRLVEQHCQTFLEFLSHILSPKDRAFLVSVGRQQRLVTDLTGSGESLQSGIETLGGQEAEILGDPSVGSRRRLFPSTVATPCGGTALWNAVYFAAGLKLRPASGRKALLVLRDGWDTGSDHTLTDAIEATEAADAVIYSIRLPIRTWHKWPHARSTEEGATLTGLPEKRAVRNSKAGQRECRQYSASSKRLSEASTCLAMSCPARKAGGAFTKSM